MQPSTKEIRAKYSVRRKRDVVTFIAIAMFVLLVLFQLFLTLVMPVILKRKNAFEFYVAKLEMSKQIDDFREKIYHMDGHDDLQRGEIGLVSGVSDKLALFTRDSLDGLDLQQIFQLKRIFGQFDGILYRWAGKRYYIVEEKLDMAAMVKSVESDIQEK